MEVPSAAAAKDARKDLVMPNQMIEEVQRMDVGAGKVGQEEIKGSCQAMVMLPEPIVAMSREQQHSGYATEVLVNLPYQDMDDDS